MVIRLKDIPIAPLNPEEVEALANGEFDYADRERVSLRAANQHARDELRDKIRRDNLREINKVFGTTFDVTVPVSEPDTLTQGYGDFTLKEKTGEVAKAVHRGMGSIIKLPGVLMKAIGELPATRAEIRALKESPYAIQRARSQMPRNPLVKRMRALANILRQTGNKYIEVVNGMMADESPESRAVRQGAFLNAPFYRTATAVGESAPTYGLAVAATLTSGNPNIGLFILGSTTASSSYDNLRRQGIDSDLALMGALLEGSIEMVTEKVPMNILLKGGGRPFLIRALRLGTAESFQELFAQMGQNYVNAVVKEIDPENLATAIQAARQEWSIITQGWEDAMAAGFTMGGGAAAFSPGPDFGRTADEMREAYGISPRNTGELLAVIEQIKQKVKAVEPFEGVLEAAAEAGRVEVPAEPPVAAPVAEPAPEDAVDIKLGLNREEVIDETLRDLSEDAFDEQFVEAEKEVIRLEEHFDEVESLSREEKIELATAQDRISAFDNERFRRKIRDIAPEDLAFDFMDINLTSRSGKVQGALFIDEVSRNPELRAAFEEGLKKRADISPDNAELVQAQLEDARQLSKELRQAQEAPVEQKQLAQPPTEAKPSIAEQRRALVERKLRAGEEVAPDVREEFADLVREVEGVGEDIGPAKKTLLDNLTSKERIELETLEKQLADKVRSQLNTGLDPEAFILATRVGGFYIKAGYRAFSEWAAQVRARIGTISDFTLRTIYSSLRQSFPGLDSDAEISASLEIGEGEVKVRGTPASIMAQAIENELVEENKPIHDELPTYRAMNMKEQADKSLALIEEDVEQAKRVAFYKEPAPLNLFPENVFSALRIYAQRTGDVDLLMDLALNEDVVREHTIMGKRIKSLDTDQDFADPVRAIREIVVARKDNLARKGKDMSALEAKLRELQAELDRTKKNVAVHTERAKREYGRKNTFVTRVEYDKIIARRKKDTPLLRHDRRRGAAYVPNPQDFSDMAKIGMFHLEALGRDFAKWSHQMARDLGEWVTPHLKGEYEKALAQAKTEDIEIKESKRLSIKKKRLATVTKKIEGKLSELDLEKSPRLPIELDEEGQRLQDAYDLAREKYKAAQSVANIITEEEVRIIAQLAKDAADRKVAMEKSKRRKEGFPATPAELRYGIAMSVFLEYVADLKAEANKQTMGEVIKNYLSNPVDFISDFAGTLKAAKASLDNSFHLRQGLPTFLKAITGHLPSAKIWWKTFMKSWRIMWDTLGKKKVMRGLFAEMVSDPDYELLKQAKVALNVVEEEIPVDIPSRIPLVGMLFRMGENAFVGSSRYMRYQLAKQYLSVWRKSGVELTKRELLSLGRLANSQTGRGESSAKSQSPGLLNNLFWSPRNLRAHIDILTLHMFDRNFSAFARRQSALNLIRYISGAAMILTLAKWIDDDSVTFDTNSADFGKIRIANTRFSVGGGMTVLIVLASRLITRKFTSSTTGKTITIDSGKFGALGGKDLIFNFVDNKLSPAAQLALSVIDQKTWEGNRLTIPQMVDDALTPLIIQNVMETGSEDDAANVLAALIAEALGVNVQTYNNDTKKKSNKRSRL